MSNFTKAKKTYTRSEVDAYIQKMMTSAELTLSQMRAEKQLLENKIEKLTRDIASYKERETRTIKALAEVARRLKTKEEESRNRTQMQVEYLSEYSEKWIKVLENLQNKYKLQPDELQLSKFVQDTEQLVKQLIEDGTLKPEQIKKIKINKKPLLSKEELDARYERIMQRIENMDMPRRGRGRPRKAENAVTKKPTVKDVPKTNEFNFEEALNPTESLTQILSDLL